MPSAPRIAAIRQGKGAHPLEQPQGIHRSTSSACLALGDKPRALEFYDQALPILRQVGDRAGEATTHFNIAMVYVALDRLSEAEEQLLQVVALEEAIDYLDLESDRAVLARVQVMRRARQDEP